MEFKIYNSMTHQKETFVPLMDKGKILHEFIFLDLLFPDIHIFAIGERMSSKIPRNTGSGMSRGILQNMPGIWLM